MTVAAAAQARAAGIIRDGDEVVALLTGNGVKTPDARRFGVDPAEIDPAPPIAASYNAFIGQYGSD